MNEPAKVRRVLIVCPVFAPEFARQTERVRLSLPHYRELGWEAVILAVRFSGQADCREEGLAATLPPELVVVRCGAWPLGPAEALGLGDLEARSWGHLLVAGARLLRRQSFDLVLFATSHPWTLCLGPIWRTVYRVPYIVDLPENGLAGLEETPAPRPLEPSARFNPAQRVTRWMERWALRRAAAIIAVSTEDLQRVHQRFPGLAEKPNAVVAVGASETDLRAARSAPAGLVPEPTPGTLRFVHLGKLGPVLPPSVSVLFRALQRFREVWPRQARYLRFEFIGTNGAASAAPLPLVKPLADAMGVGEHVIEIAHRVGHLEGLRLQSEADALLLLNTNDPAALPVGTFSGYLANRPMLAVIFRNTPGETILEELNCAIIAPFESVGSTQDSEETIYDFFSAAVRQFPTHALPTRNEAAFQQQFSVEALTAQQTALFNLVLKPAGRTLSRHVHRY